MEDRSNDVPTRRRRARSAPTSGDHAKSGQANPDAYGKALGLLARREHSARELATKLAKGGHAKGDAAAAVGRLRDDNQQSDVRFAELLARSRASRGYGPQRIRAELKSHGIGDSDIASAIDSVDCDWKAAARRQLERHYGRAEPAKSKPNDRKERARRAAFLLRRGFDAATVSALTRAEIGDPGDEFD